MQSLPLKYRPDKFEDLIGQELNSKFLSTLIKKGQIGKNIILYGPFGSSKTTSTRIYARALNCLSPTELGSPCNSCQNCQLFFSNKFPDYLEVDGSSRGRVDNIKELLDIAKSPPIYGKYRIINVDECQNLSKQAWDALLKLIEEPPPYLVFIFTTTEINKVREAIRSRCQTLEVKLLDFSESLNFLKKICEAEEYNFEEESISLISFLSNGHPRDLLKNLEQVSLLGDITSENVKIIFNLDYISNLLKLNSYIWKNELKESLEILKNWNEPSKEIYQKIVEFNIFLYYKYIKEIEIEFNPVFFLIPSNDYESLIEDIRNQLKILDCSIEMAFGKLLEFFKSSVIDSKISLDLFLFNWHSLIHINNFNMNGHSNGVIVNSSSKRSKVKKGRQFVHNVEEKVEKEEKNKESAVYKHTLLNRGFICKKLSEVNISIRE